MAIRRRIGRTIKFFEQRIHPEDRPSTLEFYRSAIARGSGDVSAEFRVVTVGRIGVRVRETLRVTGGSIAGVVAPIDRRKWLEDQLLRSGRAEALQSVASRLARTI